MQRAHAEVIATMNVEPRGQELLVLLSYGMQRCESSMAAIAAIGVTYTHLDEFLRIGIVERRKLDRIRVWADISPMQPAVGNLG